MFDINIFNSINDFAAIKDEWDNLLANSVYKTPYQCWEWNFSWAKNLPLKYSIYVVVLRDKDGSLVGIAPFQLNNNLFLFNIIGFISQHASVYPDFIIKNGMEKYVIQELVKFIDKNKKISGINFIFADPSPYISIFLNSLNNVGWFHVNFGNYSKRLFISIEGGYESYISSLSKKMRQEIRSETKKLDNLFDVNFVASSTNSNINESINILMSLNSLRWGGNPKNLHKERREAYTILQAKGGAKIFILYCDGRPAGALSALVDNETIYTEIAGFDYSIAKVDIGKIFYNNLFLWAEQEGIKYIDFSSGEESYKYRFNPIVYNKYRLIAYKKKPIYLISEYNNNLINTMNRLKQIVRKRNII